MDRPADSSPRDLPSVDRVLRTAPLAGLRGAFQGEALVRLVRQALEEARQAVLSGAPAPTAAAVAEQVAEEIRAGWTLWPVPVINATGVILHTNLGRAPLSAEAREAVLHAASYTDLEVNLLTGRRASRQHHVERLLLALTGAEAAHVTVNNASAVMLALAALARGKEVIVSRGQAVEIGGGFRIPSIMRQSGARLVEVGTTNRTRLSDYAGAIGGRTAAILHVHPSNFKIIGFEESVPLAELAALAQARDLALIDDNGSGSLLDTARFGLAHEPMPAESLAAGADLVAFSGDKLLGGPQAGILLGRGEAIRRVAGHPLARATRPDKMTMAALSATLLAYLRGDAAASLPVWQMIGHSLEEIERRALAWRHRAAQAGLEISVRPGESTVGGGSLPGETLPTVLLVLPPSVTAAALRRASPPVLARTQDQRVLLDLRTVTGEQEDALLRAACAAALAC